MNCPNDQTIERIAVLLIEHGFTDVSQEGPRPPVALHPSLDHVLACHHCREILDILMQTESVWALGGEAYPLVLPLRPLHGRPGRPVAGWSREDEATDSEEREYLAAAADTGTAPLSSPVLSLRTDDHRFLVRVFPAEGGGSIAVLVGPLDQGETADQTRGGASEPPERRVALRVGETEYVFDEEGVAVLPEPGSSELALVLRSGV